MTPFRQQLWEAVEQVTITSATDFEWFGEPVPGLPASVRRRLDPVSARESLVNRLTAYLYTHFYCPGRARPDRFTGRLPQGQDWLALETLSAANSGRGGAEPGWRVIEESGTCLRVQKNGLTVDVDLSDLAAPRTGGTAVNVSLAMPSELTKASPGFYVALSDAPWTPVGGIVRLYWNIGPDQATLLLKLVTLALNRARVGFRLKVLLRSARADRADVAVLYIDAADVERVWDVAADILAQLRVRDAAVPAMTKPLAPGLSVAEDPGNGQSFGTHRSGIVAEGIVQAREARARGVSRRLATVLDCFAEHGIDPEAPYLGRGGTDRYPRIRERPARQPSRERIAGPELHPEEALSVATLVGRRLLESAIWHDGRCAWMGFEAVAGPNSAGEMTAYRATGPDVYSGTAGIARVLADLSATTEVPEFRMHALGAIRHALAALDAAPPSARLGLYTGWTGVACAAAVVGLRLGDEECLEQALAVTGKLNTIDGSGHEFDLLGGLAGGVVGLLALATGLGQEMPAELAVELGDAILRGADRGQGGWSWPSRALPRQRGLTGLSHGASGIGFALLELFAATGLHRFKEAAEQAFRFEQAVFDEKRANWPDFRRIPGVRTRGPSFAVTWCHGAPGIALARLRAFQLLGDTSYLEQARIAAATTRNALDATLSAPAPDWAACHGLMGNAEILSLVASALDEPAYSHLARSVGLFGITHHIRHPAPWPTGPGEAEDPSVMLGLAGIAHFYLRLARSETASMLFPTPAALMGRLADPPEPRNRASHKGDNR
ncbi:lanthionine synthetase LanC family protein [Nonomuraea sp. NPDC049625]|uniref:lanthionine synthetase LanC family protein n=1 Tax=Nonomuraea sp. NPDC049625 TaxID=3155775 RepID=UPI003437D4CE